MSPRIAPIPDGAAEPLSLMHGACFPEEPWDAGAFERILALHGVFGCLAWLGEAPSGFVVARDLGGEAEILTLCVLPGMRRRGVGRALLREVIAQAGRRRLGSVVLEVAADNEAARLLYGAAGFARVGTRPRYYRRGRVVIDALILRVPTGACRDRAPPDGAPP
ncbi:MAG: GNAT family N-acetyltransferase [Alphaproteobacteria bacterium]